jgi:hypothetical protein
MILLLGALVLQIGQPLSMGAVLVLSAVVVALISSFHNNAP